MANIFGIKNRDPLTGLEVADVSEQLQDPTQTSQEDIEAISNIGQAAPVQQDLRLPDSQVALGATPMEEQQAPLANVAPPMSREASLLEELRNIRQSSDEELKSAKKADMWLALANSLNAGLSKMDQATALKATLIPNLRAIEPGVVASTSSAKDTLAERTAKINELLTQRKLEQSLLPKQASALDLAKIRESEAKAKMYEAKAAAPSPKLTEGEKTLDREFAKEYNKWTTGGKADYEENSKIFKEAIDALKKGKVSTGSLAGVGAKIPGVRTETKQLETRVRKAINSMLRATLGAQFTEAEGEKIFSQTFDPFADEAENVKNMQTELNKIEKRKQALEEQGSFFRKNKTLTGFEPVMSQENQQQQAPSSDIVERNGKRYKWNPSVGKYQLI